MGAPEHPLARSRARTRWWRLLAVSGVLLLGSWVVVTLAGVSTPGWGVVPGLLVLVAAVMVRPRYRLPTEVCPWCGYDITALELTGRSCPECGAPVPEQESGELATHVRRVRQTMPR